jgi:hypothetical protein
VLFDLRHGRAGDAYAALDVGGALEGEVLGADLVAVAQDDGPLDGVLQLADVAGPGVAGQLGAGGVAEAGDLGVVLLDEAAQEVLGEQQGVAAAQAQRRQLDVHDVEAIIKVLAEAALADVLGEVAVGGGDEAHVDLDRLAAADALEGPLLQHAQQLHLHGGRDLADLVEEEGAAVGLLEATLASAVGAGEGALLVAEQLALQQGLGERGAVEGDEGLGRPRSERVDGAGQLALAGAALAGEQDGGPRSGDLLGEAIDLLHRRAGAEQALEAAAVALAQLSAEVLGLGPQRAALHRPLDGEDEAVDVDRLHQIVVGAGAHGRDGGGDLAEGGGDDDGQAAVLLAQAREQLHAVHLRHAQVGDHDVGGELVGRAQAGGAVGLDAHGEALLPEQLLQASACAGLVVDHEDPSLVRAAGCHQCFSTGAVRAPGGGPSIGRTMRNMVRPLRLSTSRVPP